MQKTKPPIRNDRRRAILAVGLIALVALVAVRLPIRTFRDLARGEAKQRAQDHPRLLELERQLPERFAETPAPPVQATVLSLVALLLPCWAAYAVISAGMQGTRRTLTVRALQLALAVGTGFGLSSCTYFLWLVLFDRPDVMFFVLDGLFWCLLIVIFSPGRTRPRFLPALVESDNAGRPINRAALGAFAAILLVALAGLAGEAISAPEGGWDARAIWNLRARSLFRSGDAWRDAFSNSFDHTDYPLLLPAGLARVWTFAGKDAAWPGAGVGMAFTLATVAAAMSLLAVRRGWNVGLIAGIVLLGTVRLLRCGAAQYADVPLAFFILAATGLLILYDERRAENAAGEPAGLLSLAGLMAGLAAWTKNEGLLFAGLALTIHTAAAWRQVGSGQALRECGSFLMGAAPVLFILGLFKLQIPVSNDLIAGQGLSDTLHRILDPWRHVTIWRGAAAGILQVAQANLVVVPLCFVLLGRRAQPEGNIATWPIVVIGLMLAGYYTAYLTTPYDLNWHLSTSVDRLLIQVWPLAVMTVFRAMRSPEEMSQPAILKMAAIEESNPLRRKAA